MYNLNTFAIALAIATGTTLHGISVEPVKAMEGKTPTTELCSVQADSFNSFTISEDAVPVAELQAESALSVTIPTAEVSFAVSESAVPMTRLQMDSCN